VFVAVGEGQIDIISFCGWVLELAGCPWPIRMSARPNAGMFMDSSMHATLPPGLGQATGHCPSAILVHSVSDAIHTSSDEQSLDFCRYATNTTTAAFERR
jgi:hypothetical protein